MTKARGIIKIFGIVQGVGFRPFIHKLVNQFGFKGWVRNSTEGVIIDIEGDKDSIREFVSVIPDKAPVLAVIENIHLKFERLKNYTDFKIIKSDCDDEGFVLVSPDVSICEDCRRELMDPKNRRYRYPFINCTNCGPRFTIIKSLPYDRYRTTMKKFKMCRECDREYHDIENRRYHAEPDCCFKCGPHLKFCDNSGREIRGDAISMTAEKLKRGYIVAIKGIGGFHLACDALNDSAVKELRKRKHREKKPFAMMCRDIESVEKYAYVSDDERRILESYHKPIVILKKKENCGISGEIAPDTDSYGFMLPYTPIHCLLFEEKNMDALVMTSANISDNPIIYKNTDALLNLKGIADYFLLHNRDIHTRCDDSVVREIYGREYFMRRSRGYAPLPVKFNIELKPILACGAEQKASFSLSRGRYVFLSQHIGDLKNFESLANYEEQIENFKALFNIEPEIVACDIHPDYLSSIYANERYAVKKVRVQHHHAHMASCMADNNLSGDVIGITWDGTGLGTDGNIWGGEILTGNYREFKRAGSFLNTPMPGGDKAAENIYTMALSYIIKAYGSGFYKYIKIFPELKDDHIKTEVLYNMIRHNINSPYTSSCGRLFDGVSSIVGLCSVADYEGQGAMKLESVADCNIEDSFNCDIIKKSGIYVYDWRETINDILNSLRDKREISYISAAFHNTLATVALKMCILIRNDTGLNRVVLTGGVFQNIFLLKKTINILKSNGFDVYIHRRVSANDEGLSLGQLVIAQYGGGYDVSGSSFKDSIDRG
ncbi:MAG: carbamoyltransferase HypF [Clostridiales bacterium]|nr:carbamoyltransferase HypF [Clostridiales bacterium]